MSIGFDGMAAHLLLEYCLRTFVKYVHKEKISLYEINGKGELGDFRKTFLARESLRERGIGRRGRAAGRIACAGGKG
ncbi:hypothetical protein [Adlercreutzia mucosicola]|uniref:hypothetical protein n=1 Tax=Adlercreutzia mucosicola TaxID=580026 RepID=UPI00214CBEA1|nr:hypothetical protein [Adlercreutzia mucosicola]